MDFYKIFKILNGAQSSWQVALAIVFGMISAFLPLFTIINLILIIIAFSLNIPIVIFLFSSALFSILAAFLDPVFASVGYEILTNISLNNIFTSMYNQAVFLWSSYNNTIVMGSFIVSLILFYPSYLIFKILIEKYRVILEKKFKDSRFFSFLNPFTKEKIKKKPGLFRPIGLIFILSIIAIISAIILLLIDPIIKFTLEYTLSKATKSKVYISSVNSSITNTSLDINNIIIKSKKSSDDSSIKNIHIKLDSNKLLHKNINITFIQIQDIILKTSIDTNSKTNALTTIDELKKEDTSKKSSIKLPSIDELLAKEDLKSLKEAKQIQKDINLIYAKYKDFDKSKFDKKRLDELKNRALLLKDEIKNISKISQIEHILEESKAIKEELEKLNNEISDIKKDYDVDKQIIKEHISTIKTLPAQEYNHLKDKYTLDQNGALNFVQTYLIPNSKEYIKEAIKYYNIAKPYIFSDDEDEDIKRYKGQTIVFTKDFVQPSFVIEKIIGNSKVNDFSSDFKILNISSNPRLYKKIISLDVVGTNRFYKNATIRITHDELTKIAHTKIKANITDYRKNKYSANKKLSLNNLSLNSKLDASIKEYKYLTLINNTKIKKTNMSYNSNGKKMDNIIKNILSNIHGFDLNYKVNGTIEHQNISLNSNLDKKINLGVKYELKKELKKYKAKLKSKINEKFKKELGTNISDKNFEEIQNIISSFGKDGFSLNSISKSSLLKEIKHKEEAKAKKKAKQKAKEKLKNKLKSFF